MLNIPVLNTRSVANITLALLLAFSFIGLAPFSTLEYGAKTLDETGGSNLLRQIIYLLFFVVSFFCFIRKKHINDLRKCMPLVMLFGWCVLSIFWADHPSISLRRVGLLLITAITVFMLVSILSLEDILTSLSKMFVIIIVVSILAVPVITGARHTGMELMDVNLLGNWKGVFIHKNHAGPALVFAIALFIFNYHRTKKHAWLFMIGVSLVFLFFTQSKTSIVLLFPSLMFGFFMYKLSFYTEFKRIVVTLFFTFLVVFVFMLPYLMDVFVSVLDDPHAFTGRATIWNMVYLLILDNFWFGVGFGSVWNVGEDMRLVYYASGWVDWVFTLAHAHNGYLEIFASTGFVGFLLCLLVFVILPFFKGMVVSYFDSRFIFVYFSMYLFFVVHNLLEVDYLNASDGRWMIILILHFCLYLKAEKGLH